MAVGKDRRRSRSRFSDFLLLFSCSIRFLSYPEVRPGRAPPTPRDWRCSLAGARSTGQRLPHCSCCSAARSAHRCRCRRGPARRIPRPAPGAPQGIEFAVATVSNLAGGAAPAPVGAPQQGPQTRVDGRQPPPPQPRLQGLPVATGARLRIEYGAAPSDERLLAGGGNSASEVHSVEC